MRLVILAGLVCLLLLPACSAPTTPQEAESTAWKVEANLYSGRKNPSGSLTAEQGAVLEARLADLPTAPPVEMGQLGYSGFTLYPVNQGVSANLVSIMVYDGTVEVREANTTRYLLDPGRALEKWIFEAVRDGTWLSENEKQAISSEITAIVDGDG